MISDSTVEHLADSFQGLPDALVIWKNITPKSKEARRVVQPIPGDMRLQISIGMPNFGMPNFDSVNFCTTRV